MKKVTIDPGKGGYKSGVSYGNLIEKEINLNIALKCKEVLLRHKVNVEMTREDDAYVGYSQRINKANKNYSDAFISIHCNLGEGSLVEVVYSINDEKGLNLATAIGYELRKNGCKAMKLYNKLGNNSLDFNTSIRETEMDSIIVFCGYLDNEYDRSLMDTLEKQQNIGIAIAKGILNYFKIEYDEKEI